MKRFSKSILSLIVCLILGTTCSMSVFAEDTADTNIKVAFAGDSICIGYKNYYGFPGVTIDNYGVGGYTTEEVLEVVQGIQGDYDKLFLICGINDCSFDGWLEETFEDSMANFRGMFEAAKENLPNTKVYVTGTFPTLNKNAKHVPYSLQYNALLKQLTTEYDNVTFIGDACWPALLDSETGLGKAEYYNKDGLHPKKEGYDVLNEVLKPYMYDDNSKQLEGNVYYQMKNQDNSSLRFVAEMNIEDVMNANSGSYTVSLNDNEIANFEIGVAYKSIKANGVLTYAPEGKCYVVTEVVKGYKTGDKLTADFIMEGFDKGLNREVIM